VPFIHGLASRAFGRKAGVLAPLLFGLNAFAVQYAQEARAYAFVLLLVTASTYLLMRAAEAGSTWRWAAYAIVSALAVYAHFFALVVLGTHALALALLLIGPDAPISRSVSAGRSFGALLSRAPLRVSSARWGIRGDLRPAAAPRDVCSHDRQQGADRLGP
jgi:4-amino-4-deoxy-L-arabinose transferase-like glycosyltransferase